MRDVMPAAHDRINIDVNAVPMIADYVMPILTGLAFEYPNLTLSYHASMNYTEVAPGAKTLYLRGGPPVYADGTTVWPLGLMRFRLFGAPAYLEKVGLPRDVMDLQRFGYVTHDRYINRAPWERWLFSLFPDLTPLLRSDNEIVHRQAVAFGHCLGFLPISSLLTHTSLIEVFPVQPQWSAEVSLAADDLALQDPLFAEITQTLVRRLRASWADDI